ncbi:hypothetical protein KP13_05079 [Klebsiella pneumoniae subsp. pneumoniae Kp13]|nr:hypothetical protein KP13_05079 [Klebsiella pneumoniae subsp. pneumoniae Kp13]
MACPCFRAGAFFWFVSVSIPGKRSINICGLLAFLLALLARRGQSDWDEGLI